VCCECVMCCECSSCLSRQPACGDGHHHMLSSASESPCRRCAMHEVPMSGRDSIERKSWRVASSEWHLHVCDTHDVLMSGRGPIEASSLFSGSSWTDCRIIGGGPGMRSRFSSRNRTNFPKGRGSFEDLVKGRGVAH
jgi:hypothetical protein